MCCRALKALTAPCENTSSLKSSNNHPELQVDMSEQSSTPSLLVAAVGNPEGVLRLDNLEAFDGACSLHKAAIPEETSEAYHTLAILNSEDRPSPLTETAMRSLIREGFKLGPKTNLRDTKVSVVVCNGAAGWSGLAARTLGLDPCPSKTDISFDEAIAFAEETTTKAHSSVLNAAVPWVLITFSMQEGKNGRAVSLYSRPTESSQLEALRTAFHKERPAWTMAEALTGRRWIPEEADTELATIMRAHGHEL
ncbi:hypothetical protein EHS25_005214 [Saitozyma podzolica]|uniref:Uncharacterized protein n=1 Tax=Saitozyma podzolica TaxID=1890683 RepID=A0A427XYR1_9TREE|nr:hypothetical protein EHS25_005214 [Saitozyma podzolica]